MSVCNGAIPADLEIPLGPDRLAIIVNPNF